MVHPNPGVETIETLNKDDDDDDDEMLISWLIMVNNTWYLFSDIIIISI